MADRPESAAARADRRYREDARIIGSWPGDWQPDATEDRLEAIRQRHIHYATVREDECCDLGVVLAALAAVTEERDAARADAERLARYAQHTRGCLNWTWPESCDCGFDTQVVPIVRGLAAHRSLR